MDPLTIGAAVAIAKTAVAGVKELISLGHEIQDCYHDIATFFDKQTEIEIAVIEQKKQKLQAVKEGKPQRSATAEALEATFASREMIRLEKELKEALIYGSQESGLYDEMCQRRNAIILERKREIEDAEREERMRLAEIRRKKEQRIQNIQEWLAVVLGVSLSSFVMYAIWWMFKNGGKD